MKKNIVVAIISLALLSQTSVSNTVRAQAPDASTQRVTLIRAGALIDGTGGPPRKNQMILVRGNRIEKIADASAQVPSGAAVIDLSSVPDLLLVPMPGRNDGFDEFLLVG